MKLKYIDINGVVYPVVFTMQTMTNFEEIINKGFFEANWNTHILHALCIHSVYEQFLLRENACRYK